MQPLAETQIGCERASSLSRKTSKGSAFVQATFQGTPYLKMVMPGAPSTGVQVQVFESTTKDVAKVLQHMILLQPGADAISVSETHSVSGRSQADLQQRQRRHDPLLRSAGGQGRREGDHRLRHAGRQSIPIQRQVDKSKTPNVYKIDYPIKPGETRVDITYTLPPSPMRYSGKILHKEGKTRLVVPNGVSAKGDNMVEVGTRAADPGHGL